MRHALVLFYARDSVKISFNTDELLGRLSMSWTDNRVTILKKLWSEGKTAAEIANELGGVTRNAVIGKAHRLKLSNRGSMVQTPKKKIKKKVNTASKSAPANANVAPRKSKISIDDQNRERIPLTDLKPNACKWPIGDPKSKDFGFCGDHKVPGIPYCVDHAQVAYQAATRNRILKSPAVRDMMKKSDKKAMVSA